jgi:peptidoglycan DL-endopeptidase CwlO
MNRTSSCRPGAAASFARVRAFPRAAMRVLLVLAVALVMPAAAATKKAPGKSAAPRDDSGDDAARGRASANASLRPEELAGFAGNPAGVQRLIRTALELTRRGLTYRFGSCDPKRGGMDCSGTVHYALRQLGIEPPRDCSGMFLWAKGAGTLREARPKSLEDASLRALRPGDLMFWEGTYGVRRSPPISHVMIYLGREKATGAPVMVGSSDGRSYRGKRRNGVSVFDFKLPGAGSNAKFVGYARVPQL